MKYPVTEIFPTLQGEGHFSGHRAVFVRFAGCSVRDCHIRDECDTDYGLRERLTTLEVVRRVFDLADSGIVVLTGGEPADYDLQPVVAELRQQGYRVHLETSGAKSVEGLPFDWITVSPKTPDYVQRSGHTLKIVVRPDMGPGDIDVLDHGAQFLYRYLQPLDFAGVMNTEQVIDLVTSDWNADGRWALGHQAHKTWGVL